MKINYVKYSNNNKYNMELKKAIEIAEAYNNWLSGGFKNFTYTVTERKMALVVLIQLGKNKLHNID